MASVSWAGAGLPQRWEFGAPLDFPSGLLRSPVDGPTAKSRSIYTVGERAATLNVRLESQAELNSLLSFYTTTLGNGVERFDLDDPWTGETSVEFRFTSRPRVVKRRPNYLVVELPLERVAA